jgi:hypothetical protein
MEHRIPKKQWCKPLTKAIRTAKDGDKIIVPTIPIKGATLSALPILRDEEEKHNITVEVAGESTV